jgi:hypothetical protein
VRLDAGELGNLADLEVELVGDLLIHAPERTRPALG